MVSISSSGESLLQESLLHRDGKMKPSRNSGYWSLFCYHVAMSVGMASSAQCDQVLFRNHRRSDCETVGGELPNSTSCRTIDTASRRDAEPAVAGSRMKSDPIRNAREFWAQSGS